MLAEKIRKTDLKNWSIRYGGISQVRKGKKYFLQLGSVLDIGIAEVKINGKDKGVLWSSPFRVKTNKDLQKGVNNLEVKVINSWYNRVAGDEMFPDKKQFTIRILC